MKAANKTKNIFIRRLFLAITDILSVIAASLLALLLRFNLTIDSIEGKYLEVMWNYLPISIIITLILFYIFRLGNLPKVTQQVIGKASWATSEPITVTSPGIDSSRKGDP